MRINRGIFLLFIFLISHFSYAQTSSSDEKGKNETDEEKWTLLINAGAEDYQNNKMESALNYFLEAKELKPNDTTSLIYVAVSAHSLGYFDLALENYNALLSQNYYDEEIYGSIYYIYYQEKKDFPAARKVLEDAIYHFPGNNDFKSLEIDLLLSMSEVDEATRKLEDFLSDNPTNPNLFFSLGYIYDEAQNPEKAKVNYEKALELKPDHYEANVNLAIIYFNQAIMRYQEINDLSMKDYQERGAELELKAKELMKESIPYWENALKIKPESLEVMDNLLKVYEQLGMEVKAGEMRKKINAIENKD